MSDLHETQVLKNEIFICNDVLYNLFGFLERAELGLKLAFVNYRFNALVDKFLKAKQWRIYWLEYRWANDGSGAELVKHYKSDNMEIYTKKLPIVMNTSLPDSLNGFERISIRYFDHNAIAFLRSIRRLFNKEIRLSLNMISEQKKSWDIMAREIWPLVSEKLGCLNFRQRGGIARLLQMFPNFLCECTELRLIVLNDYFLNNFLRDNRGSPADVLFNWLHVPRKDGRPKVLKFGDETTDLAKYVDEFKKEFVKASTSASFIVQMDKLNFNGAEFVLENWQMREKLIFRHKKPWDERILMRVPIEYKKRSRRWKLQQLDPLWSFYSCNAVSVELRDSRIGQSRPMADDEDE